MSATFTIGDVASGSITTPLSVADNANWQLMALSRGSCSEPNPMWLVGLDPQFSGYDLVSELGPVALTMPGASPGISVDTSREPGISQHLGAVASCPVARLVGAASAIERGHGRADPFHKRIRPAHGGARGHRRHCSATTWCHLTANAKAGVTGKKSAQVSNAEEVL